MDETELQEYRRQRLADWLKSNGGPHVACQRRGLGKNTESYISQVLGGITFGQRAARNMEAKLGLDKGYLDDMGLPTTALSPMALELAKMFDVLTDQIDRTVAYNAATEVILRLHAKHDPQPSAAPAQAATPKKLRG